MNLITFHYGIFFQSVSLSFKVIFIFIFILTTWDTSIDADLVRQILLFIFQNYHSSCRKLMGIEFPGFPQSPCSLYEIPSFLAQSDNFIVYYCPYLDIKLFIFYDIMIWKNYSPGEQNVGTYVQEQMNDSNFPVLLFVNHIQ